MGYTTLKAALDAVVRTNGQQQITGANLNGVMTTLLQGVDVLDRANPADTSGMNKVVLKKNKTFAEQVTEANTFYEIRDAFNLGGGSVNIPAGCILFFNGGKISNGSVSFSDTILVGCDYLCLDDITLSGSIKNNELNADCSYVDDIGETINNLFNVVNVVRLGKRKYDQSTTILLSENNKKIIGYGCDKIVEAGGYQTATTEISTTLDIESVSISAYGNEINGIRFIADATNTHAGIHGTNSHSGIIANCEITNFAVGIHLQGGFGFSIKNNRILGSVFGLALMGSTASQINGAYLENNYVKLAYCGFYLTDSNNITLNHNTFEVIHPDYADRTITYTTFNYPKSAVVIIYRSKNTQITSTYAEGANCLVYIDTASRCVCFDNVYYNSHIGATYIKPFTGNFFGYMKNAIIRNVYFAQRVNETTALDSKTNGVIYAQGNVVVEGCVLSYVIASGDGNVIGKNIYETARFGGVLFSGTTNTVVIPWGLGLTGGTSNRPSFQNMPKGLTYFDTDLGKMIVYNGSAWVNMDGTALA